jgi:hypothetical protein
MSPDRQSTHDLPGDLIDQSIVRRILRLAEDIQNVPNEGFNLT